MISRAFIGLKLAPYPVAVEKGRLRFFAKAITCSGTVTALFLAGGERRARLTIQTCSTDRQLKLAGDAVVALT